jgi:hypothetical protein
MGWLPMLAQIYTGSCDAQTLLVERFAKGLSHPHHPHHLLHLVVINAIRPKNGTGPHSDVPVFIRLASFSFRN